MSGSVSLYEAKTHLSNLVERAARGEDIVITKHGVPRARLVPIVQAATPRTPARALRIGHLADDFDAVSAEVVNLFAGDA